MQRKVTIRKFDNLIISHKTRNTCKCGEDYLTYYGSEINVDHILPEKILYAKISDYYKSIKKDYKKYLIDIKVGSGLSSPSISLTDQIISAYNNVIKQRISNLNTDCNFPSGSNFNSVSNRNASVPSSLGLQFNNKIKYDSRSHAIDSIIAWLSLSESIINVKPLQYLKENIKDNKDALKKEIKLIRKLLIGYKRRKVLGYCYVIDRRMIFRTIIRFLFKNLDDCSDSNNVLDTMNTIALLIRTIIKHEKNRNYKLFARVV